MSFSSLPHRTTDDRQLCILNFVQRALRSVSVEETGSKNELGDKQLIADIEAERIVRNALQSCPAVAVISSEEAPRDIVLHESGDSNYSVAYDPLDGSSIIGANWAVGSIFGVWPREHRTGKTHFVGRPGRDQVAAAYAVYGPRTSLIVARPSMPEGTVPFPGGYVVQEFTLLENSWILKADAIQIPQTKKIFAPANLRAAKENAAYAELIQKWIGDQYTLRYSGGLVPDTHHILCKGGGVFCNPDSASAPAKLRMLYECMPLAFIVEAAGGCAGTNIEGHYQAVLDTVLQSHDHRSTICLGSKQEVEKCASAMSSS